MNSKAGRLCLLKFALCIYDAFYSLKLLTKMSPPVLWEMRELSFVQQLFAHFGNVPEAQMQGCYCSPVKLFAVKAFNILRVSLM